MVDYWYDEYEGDIYKNKLGKKFWHFKRAQDLDYNMYWIEEIFFIEKKIPNIEYYKGVYEKT